MDNDKIIAEQITQNPELKKLIDKLTAPEILEISMLMTRARIKSMEEINAIL